MYINTILFHIINIGDTERLLTIYMLQSYDTNIFYDLTYNLKCMPKFRDLYT